MDGDIGVCRSTRRDKLRLPVARAFSMPMAFAVVVGSAMEASEAGGEIVRSERSDKAAASVTMLDACSSNPILAAVTIAHTNCSHPANTGTAVTDFRSTKVAISEYRRAMQQNRRGG